MVKIREFRNLTSICLFADHVRNLALVGDRHALLLNRTTAVVKTLRLIHCSLKGVASPAEHIVGMRTVRAPFEAPDKRIGSTCGPHAVELGRVPGKNSGLVFAYLRKDQNWWLERRRLGCSEIFIPGGFKGHLWYTNGMRCRARGGIVEVVRVHRVVHMGLMVGTIKVLPIPASKPS